MFDKMEMCFEQKRLREGGLLDWNSNSI